MHHLLHLLFHQAAGLLRPGLVVLLLVACGCDRQDEAKVLARVGDREIRTDEFVRQLQMAQAGSPVPVDRSALLEEMVAREVIVQAAHQAELANDPEVLKAISNVLIATLKERQLSPRLEAAEISAADVNAAYDQHPENFISPERVRLAVLFVETETAGSGVPAEEARQRLETALGKARAGATGGSESAPNEGFGAIAVAYSEDQETRYRGGDLGWIERGRYPRRIEPSVIDAGFALQQPGEISDVIAGAKGLYVVKLLEKQAAAPVPLEKVAAGIRQQLLRDKRDQIQGDFQTTLRDGLRIEVHAERLDSIPASTPAQEPIPPTIQ